jgi:hypothetical protein
MFIKVLLDPFAGGGTNLYVRKEIWLQLGRDRYQPDILPPHGRSAATD